MRAWDRRSPRRLRRAFGRLGAAISLGLTFLFALVVGIAVHLPLPAFERLLLGRANALMAETFRGRIVLDDFRSVGLGRVSGLRARVFDPRGDQVVALEDGRAELDVVRALRSLVVGQGPIELVLSVVEVHSVDVVLVEEDGQLTLAQAFEPRQPAPDRPQARRTEVTLERVRIGRLAARGRLSAIPDVDLLVSDLEASVDFGADVTIRGHALTVAARGLPIVDSLSGDLSGELRVPTKPGRVVGYGAFDGLVGDTRTLLRGGYDGENLLLEAELYRAAPAELRELTGVAISAPVDARVTLSGPLEGMALAGTLAAGSSQVTLSGELALEPELRATAVLVGDALDASLVSPSAPRSAADVLVELSLTRRAGGVYGGFELTSERFALGDEHIPALRAKGELLGDKLRALVLVAEPGTTVALDLTLDAPALRGGDGVPTLEYRLQARTRDLRRIPRLPATLSGHAEITAWGHVALAAPVRVDLDLEGHLSELAAGDATARRASVLARVRGRMPDLELEATTRVLDLRVGDYRFDRATLSARGPISALRVSWQAASSDGAQVRGSAVLDARRAEARGVDVRLSRGKDVIDARVARARRSGGRTEVERLELRGTQAGALEVSAAVDRQRLMVDARGKDVDVSALARMLGLAVPLRSGTATFDVRLEGSRRSARGYVRASVKELSFDDVKNGSLDVDLRVAGRSLEGSIRAAVGDLANLDLALSPLTLPAGRLGVPALRRATGSIALRGRVDLTRLDRYLPVEGLPIGSTAGKLVLDARVARSDAARLPDAHLYLASDGLALSGPLPTESMESTAEVRMLEPWRIDGIDAQLWGDVGADGRVSLRGELHDTRGTVLSLLASSELPEEMLVLSSRELEAALVDAPLELELRVPPRRLEQLPPVLRPASMRGRLALALVARGKVGTPTLDVTLLARGLRPVDERPTVPLDVHAQGRYDGARGVLEVAVTREGAAVLQARSSVSADLGPLLFAVHRRPPIRLDTQIRAQGFPLHALTSLSDQRLHGYAFGDIELIGLGQDAQLRGDLRLQEFRVGEVEFQTARVALAASDGQLGTQLWLDGRGGAAHARLDAPIRWGSRLAPELSGERPVEGHITARNLRAKIAEPLVTPTLSALDGAVDADISLQAGAGRDRIRGYLALNGGVVEVPSLGQELREVSGRLEFSEGGRVRLARASARGYTGRIDARGSARLRGLTLERAQLTATIPEGQEIPLTVEGVAAGHAWGRIDVRAGLEDDARTRRLEIELPRFHLALPAVPRQKVQELEDDPRVKTGVYLHNRRFVTLPLQPLEASEPSRGPRDLRVTIRLGDDVWVRRGTQLQARLAGALEVDARPELAISGRLTVPRGTIDVSGKPFQVERAVITFRPEEPTNPTVVASAFWDSPEGYRVHADYAGPANGGKLSLRSEPPLKQNQILSLVLFGIPDGQFGVSQSAGDQSSTAETALGLGGGVATKALNRALSDLTSLDVQARIDTSTGTAQPEIAIQLSPRVTAELGYAVGAPGPGESPDRTFFTLGARVKRRWSVSATVGDRGSTLWDLIWKWLY